VKKLMLGNEGIARGAYEAGVRVATAYPGTPSTEIIEFAAKYDEIYAEWAPNEKVAMEVAIGASFAGARAMVAMKHVGLNVAADPLFTVSYTGINAGLVIVVADDPGMHSSQNEQDSRCYARAAQVPMLEPADSQEAIDFVKFAYELSEKYDTPILVRMTTRVSHSQSIAVLGIRNDIPLREYRKLPEKNVMMPAMARRRHQAVKARMKDIAEAACDMWVNRIEMNDPSVGVIASGIAYQYAKEALPNASILKLGMVNPLPRKLIESFAAKVDKLFVIEELEPIIEEQIRSWGISVIGKELFPSIGELSANIIAEKVLGETPEVKPLQDIPTRPPVMCPGCPHRGVFYVIRKLRLYATGDIGCYTLGALPPLQAMDTCVCMGASIGMAHGMEKARGRDFGRKLVAVIGDSTFIHSGITGLIDVVYNQGNSTVVILDNSTTGMTGHQDHPGTGCTLKGSEVPPLDLVKLIEAIGIKHIRVVDPFELDQVEKVLREEVQRDEPSVVIMQRSCALLNKSVKPPVEIDLDLCRKCNACLRLGCPAIQKKQDAMVIDLALCNGCGLCIGVCRFNAIRRTGE